MPKWIEGRRRDADAKRIYRVWSAMVQRCCNPNNAAYRNYGAKGVRVCDRWRSFDAFIADMGTPEVGMSIERIDSRGSYEPSNCTWIPRRDQSKNRPDWCYAVQVNDETMTLKDAWRSVAPGDVTYRAVQKRMARGWSIGAALTAAPRTRC